MLHIYDREINEEEYNEQEKIFLRRLEQNTGCWHRDEESRANCETLFTDVIRYCESGNQLSPVVIELMIKKSFYCLRNDRYKKGPQAYNKELMDKFYDTIFAETMPSIDTFKKISRRILAEPKNIRFITKYFHQMNREEKYELIDELIRYVICELRDRHDLRIVFDFIIEELTELTKSVENSTAFHAQPTAEYPIHKPMVESANDLLDNPLDKLSDNPQNDQKENPINKQLQKLFDSGVKLNKFDDRPILNTAEDELITRKKLFSLLCMCKSSYLAHRISLLLDKINKDHLSQEIMYAACHGLPYTRPIIQSMMLRGFVIDNECVNIVCKTNNSDEIDYMFEMSKIQPTVEHFDIIIKSKEYNVNKEILLITRTWRLEKRLKSRMNITDKLDIIFNRGYKPTKEDIIKTFKSKIKLFNITERFGIVLDNELLQSCHQYNFYPDYDFVNTTKEMLKLQKFCKLKSITGIKNQINQYNLVPDDICMKNMVSGRLYRTPGELCKILVNAGGVITLEHCEEIFDDRQDLQRQVFISYDKTQRKRIDILEKEFEKLGMSVDDLYKQHFNYDVKQKLDGYVMEEYEYEEKIVKNRFNKGRRRIGFCRKMKASRRKKAIKKTENITDKESDIINALLNNLDIIPKNKVPDIESDKIDELLKGMADEETIKQATETEIEIN